ncbi:MAG: SufS family cysteine desulfurase, partial [Bradyrhizobium icense]
IAFAGEHSRVETNGVNLLKGRQHADTTLFMDHAVPHCASREVFRAVLDDSAHSVFQGRIIVRPDAQKTDAKMMTRALLLSDDAEADNKPELEIFADDVTCGHGATSGALDESLLFYLRARGLPEKEAQALLIQAFVGEAVMTQHPAVANGSYDVARVREDFPALKLKVYGKQLVYLDNAASAQKPNAVLDRMTQAYHSEYANVHRGLHYLANAATEGYEGARAKVAQFVNARRNEEIIFTRNVTEAINLVASSWGEPNIKEGDEIVLSIMEHHSNIVPWHFLRERHGAVIKWAPVDDDGNFLIDEFERLLTKRTKLVAITQMSNALGTFVPVKQAIKLAHDRGIKVLVDGAQGAVHLPVDVQDLDCDFYAFTGHKVYGPTGIGVLYAKHEHLVAMRPFNGGGEMIREVAKDWVTYGDPPHKFEAGTPPIVEAIGLGAAIDYVNSIGKERIAAHEQGLLNYAQERMREINSLRLIGTARDKGPVISFEMKGAHAHDVATVIDRQGVAVRAGTHCVMPLLERFNVTATCRASFGMYNTKEEVDHLVQALLKARELFA